MFLINLNLSFFLLPSGVVFFSYDFIDNVYEQFFFSYDHSFNNNIFTVGNAWYVWSNYFFIGPVLLFTGLARIIFSKNNLLLMMLGLEMLMLACIYSSLTWFEIICSFTQNDIDYTCVIVFLTIVVSESAVGLTLIILLSKNLKNLSMLSLSKLKG